MEEKELNENVVENEQNEVVEEPVKEVEEEKEIQPKKDELDSSIDIKKPAENAKSYDQVVEEERQLLIKSNKKKNIISTISMVGVLALAITGFFLLNTVPVVAYILEGTSIAVLITFSIILRKVANPDVQGYIVRASTAINEFTFADNRFTEVKYDPRDKLELGDVISDGLYLGLVRTASRNVVEGKFNGRSFKVCECALFKPNEGRKPNPAFIGKYLSLTNNLHFEGRIILVSKGQTDTDIPDDLADLVQVENDGLFFAYAPDEKTYKSLKKKLISSIKEIKVSNHLMNLIVVLWAGRSIVYASYDDPTITLPFNEPYIADTAVQYRSNLIELLSALEIINEE